MEAVLHGIKAGVDRASKWLAVSAAAGKVKPKMVSVPLDTCVWTSIATGVRRRDATTFLWAARAHNGLCFFFFSLQESRNVSSGDSSVTKALGSGSNNEVDFLGNVAAGIVVSLQSKEREKRRGVQGSGQMR